MICMRCAGGWGWRPGRPEEAPRLVAVCLLQQPSWKRSRPDAWIALRYAPNTIHKTAAFSI